MNRVVVPRMDPEEIEHQAVQFLTVHGVDGPPTPIDFILEHRLDIDIVPMPQLQRDFSIDGFITSDCKEIYIDEDMMISVPTRYRFTLAHELGHRILHRDIWSQFEISNIEDYIEFLTNNNERATRSLEWQGHRFAGAVLMPQRWLESRVVEAGIEGIEQLESNGLALRGEALWDWLAEYVAHSIAHEFDVSVDAMAVRIKALGLCRNFVTH